MFLKRVVLKSLALVVFAVALVSCGRTKGKTDGEGQASIVFDTQELWMGSFPSTSGPQSVVFTFRNEGDADLEFLDVATGCWCVSTVYPEKPLKPGKKGKIEVTVDVSDMKPGKFHHYAYFAVSGSPAQFTLTVKGEITEK